MRKSRQARYEADMELIKLLLLQEAAEHQQRIARGEVQPPKPFIPTKMKCLHCNSVFWSEYPGHFASCKCGKSSVDETRHYMRILGDLDKVVPAEEGENNERTN